MVGPFACKQLPRTFYLLSAGLTVKSSEQSDAQKLRPVTSVPRFDGQHHIERRILRKTSVHPPSVHRDLRFLHCLSMSDSYGAELLDVLAPGAHDTSGGSDASGASGTAADTPLTHTRTENARKSRPTDWPDWVDPDLRDHLVDQGITAPWLHQRTTAERAWTGHDVVVATGTASGKSLGYQLPALSRLAGNRPAAASCLYLSPTKALAQDQLGTLAELCSQVPGLRDIMVASYDGDTPQEARRTIRDEARIIVSNPDMVHASILGQSSALVTATADPRVHRHRRVPCLPRGFRRPCLPGPTPPAAPGRQRRCHPDGHPRQRHHRRPRRSRRTPHGTSGHRCHRGRFAPG
jgi:peptidoglycan hydrolase-like protein with peptidoglycan-binding domain